MKIARMVPPCIALLLLLPAGELTSGASDSIASGTTTPAPGTNLTRKVVKPAPSTLEKIGTGTKKLFTGIGDALTPGKKSTTKTAVNPYTAAKKNIKKPGQAEKKSWLTNLFSSKTTTTTTPKPASSH